jgi:hypothetical protein
LVRILVGIDMDNFSLFVCGVVVTLIAGMGIITSEVFLGYKRFMAQTKTEKSNKEAMESV